MVDANNIIKQLQEENIQLKEKLNEVNMEIENMRADKMTALILGNAIGDGICVVDSRGIVTDINSYYTELTEITEEEIIGRPILELLEKKYF